MNLIKIHFAERLAHTTLRSILEKNGNKNIFILTLGFCFLDIINYLGPSTSCKRWIKAYDCSAEKSWLPYECFDSPDKLDFPGLPGYCHWHL